MLIGRVEVGEIMPADAGRTQACFHLSLPGASGSSWHPAADITEARRLAAIMINEWMNAAGVVPAGRKLMADVEKHPGPFAGPDAEFARDCAMAAIKWYGTDDEMTHQRIMKGGVWNDHVAVQAALAAIHHVRAHGLPPAARAENHKLDTDRRVFFYEQDFYVLSNFSAFKLAWKGVLFDTSEAAYHWEKFPGDADVDGIITRWDLRERIRDAASAHEAFKTAEHYKNARRADWDAVKVDIMRDILRAKAAQHEYVRRKLLATGNRELIEDSWRDDFWGWGPNRDGQNMLGKLWMEVRAELRSELAGAAS
ncbi:NADAR family protein [Bradyrhizobium elkanii]|uniref:NADAR family protein n=1 Tax=Bradyrhizobium elkanii TaxID=29448 RepID=UPI00086AE5D6|nr:NADAR family protein [Bradyrhizobium elkanii]ODM71700.1 hypothetical protein A6X20_07095 [Bradyrhizobium elkanii]ODM79073.1 hypothetical protein A6452_28680 [Bradyrhizobium elkanii]